MKEIIPNTKHEKDRRIFALCQKCGRHIYKCEDFMETQNKSVIFRIKCNHCGWLFSHQIFVSQVEALPPVDIEGIAKATMKALKDMESGDANRFRVK